MGAAIAFYSMFSLAPLLAMAVMVAGIAFGVDTARSQIVSQLGSLITLFVGATGVFLELRNALDLINRKAAARKRGLSWMLRVRMMSFALVLAIGFVALVSLALSAALSVLAHWLAATMPLLATFVLLLDTLLSLAIITSLILLLLRWVPSVQPRRVSLWPGALVSGLLFVLGKHLVGLYLGREGFTSAFGAAGSLVVILMWVYYCSQVLLLGAEYNKVRAEQRMPADVVEQKHAEHPLKDTQQQVDQQHRDDRRHEARV
jgi:membrane protein